MAKFLVISSVISPPLLHTLLVDAVVLLSTAGGLHNKPPAAKTKMTAAKLQAEKYII